MCVCVCVLCAVQHACLLVCVHVLVPLCDFFWIAQSAFYHIGTTKEYIHHFTSDPVLRRDLKLQSVVEVASVKSSQTTDDGK